MPTHSIENENRLRAGWLQRLSDLVDDVEAWSNELGWSTRRIHISKRDAEFGRYDAPALLLQKAATRILLEPITRSAPGYDGVVDLYVMPAYDDLASLCHRGDRWEIHDLREDSGLRFDDRFLGRSTLQAAIESMNAHAERA